MVSSRCSYSTLRIGRVCRVNADDEQQHSWPCRESVRQSCRQVKRLQVSPAWNRRRETHDGAVGTDLRGLRAAVTALTLYGYQ